MSMKTSYSTLTFIVFFICNLFIQCLKFKIMIMDPLRYLVRIQQIQQWLCFYHMNIYQITILLLQRNHHIFL